MLGGVFITAQRWDGGARFSHALPCHDSEVWVVRMPMEGGRLCRERQLPKHDLSSLEVVETERHVSLLIASWAFKIFISDVYCQSLGVHRMRVQRHFVGTFPVFFHSLSPDPGHSRHTRHTVCIWQLPGIRVSASHLPPRLGRRSGGRWAPSDRPRSATSRRPPRAPRLSSSAHNAARAAPLIAA